MDQVSKHIIEYIETEILPQYNSIGGHTDKHIRQVIERSLNFFKQAPELNIDMVYIIAAYHDLGRLVDNETHNLESAKLLRKDKFIKEHFTDEEINIMAEAVEDHRASLGREPRSIYGKLVSSADRNTSLEETLSRSFDYTSHINPDMTEDEIIETARKHLRKKYSPDGYAAKTMYFEDPNFTLFLNKTEEITRDSETFAKTMCEHNKKRGK
ncbi:MAG: HD domain-containing protein [Candidatus Saccharibacteria bacterium]|nr:HD domain-containing protein [Candidatus Saccharibacteria bacterium]